MTNNDLLRSIRYMLDFSDAQVAQVAKLCDPLLPIDKTRVQSFLKQDHDDGYLPCNHRYLLNFLDGLIIYYRGRTESCKARPVDKQVTNNLVLKKLRIALKLNDLAMHQMTESAGLTLSRSEMSAFFRQPGHKHFRLCGDQIMRHFLKGLTIRLRGKQ